MIPTISSFCSRLPFSRTRIFYELNFSIQSRRIGLHRERVTLYASIQGFVIISIMPFSVIIRAVDVPASQRKPRHDFDLRLWLLKRQRLHCRSSCSSTEALLCRELHVYIIRTHTNVIASILLRTVIKIFQDLICFEHGLISIRHCSNDKSGTNRYQQSALYES